MLVETATGLGLPLGEAISGLSMAARRRGQRWAAFCCGRLVGRAGPIGAADVAGRDGPMHDARGAQRAE